MMRILYFSRGYTTHDWRFLDKLAQTSHEVWYLALEDDGTRYESRPLPSGIRSLSWPEPLPAMEGPADWARCLPLFEALLERIRPDLIHAGPVPSCGFIAALSGFHPVMAMSWGSDILQDAERDDAWRQATLQALRHADMIQCDCQAVRSRIQAMASIPDDRFVMFPWGVERARFRPGRDRVPNLARRGWERDTLILSTRSWEPIYGIETLLEGFRLAYRRHPRLKLLLAADGSLAPRVHDFLEASGLQSVVQLPGRIAQEDLPAYYRAADVYVSCAESDGSSVSLLEAMATGLPVIVTDLPSNREWVQSGRNGWLVAANDPRSVAEALGLAAEMEPADRAVMAQANIDCIAERADWDANFCLLLEAYERLGLQTQTEVSA